MLNMKYLFWIIVALTVLICVWWGIVKCKQGDIQALNQREQSIAQIASLTASGDLRSLRQALIKGLENGLTINEINEILIQQYAYAGFPRALNGINTFISIIDERKAAGIKDAEGTPGKPLPQTTDKNTYGAQVQEGLIGAPTQGTYKTFAPAIDAFLKEHLFADIFGRGVLSYQDREIATISALSTIPDVEPQLRSHIKVGLHIGLTPMQITDILTITKSCKGEKTLKQILSETNGHNKSDSLTHEVNQAQLEPVSNKQEKIQVIKGDKISFSTAPTSNFSGNVQVGRFLPDDTGLNLSAGIVQFEAGARTAWHTHPQGQLLIIADGSGRVQQEGEEIIEVTKGDIVWFPPHIKHWHGALENESMSHYSFARIQDGKSSNWLEKVTD